MIILNLAARGEGWVPGIQETTKLRPTNLIQSATDIFPLKIKLHIHQESNNY